MAQPADQQVEHSSPDTEIECEIDDLIAEHGSKRAVIRALLHDMTVLMADGDRSTSRGFLRGRFSDGARRPQVDDEP